jgi:hypothetical protein
MTWWKAIGSDCSGLVAAATLPDQIPAMPRSRTISVAAGAI